VLTRTVPAALALVAAAFVTVSSRGTPPQQPTAPPTFIPQASRVFLFVLGSGRLQEPSKGLDATVDFIRTRLCPKDQVAAFAWNPATAFTSDHERVAPVIDRLREENDVIDQETLALVRKIGIPYDARLRVPAETRFIRVIVYDAAADRVGSAGVAVR
jgi:hypothetical protein